MAHTYDEALESSLQYFGGDQMRATTFLQKYALKSLEGDEYYEKDPDDLHDRLADEFYRIEQQFENPLSREKIREELDGFGHIIPNGSPMAAIGNDIQLMSASNCFVAGNTTDSYGGISAMDEDLAQIMKRRGGVGIDISHLRPKGSNVANAARSSTGAVSFMERFSDTTREVAQGGRRGALMITMHIRHPDAEDFIHIKGDETSVTGANISLKVTDDFMRAVYEGEEFIQRYPVEASPEEAQITKRVDAKEIWHQIVDMARDHAEPGVLFWDQMTSDTPADCYADLGYKTHSTNPCLTGDTEVWVADGRGAVDFKTLAEEGQDVPVYTKRNDGALGVKTMRNPRVTGENKEVYEVTLENGHSFKATSNHKLLSNESGYVPVEELEEGESLHIGTSHYGSLSEAFGIEGSGEDYNLLSNSSQNRPKTEHRIIYEFHKGDISENEVIHHQDFDSKNNDPENLVAMDREAHKELHRQNMMGEDNPYHQMGDEWKADFASHPGEENGKFSGVSNEEFRNRAIEFAQALGRRFTKWEWQSYAKDHGLPKTLSEFRRTEEYSTVTGFGKWAAKQAGVSSQNELHAHTIKHISDMQSQGYDVRVLEEGVVEVSRECENCGDEYWVRSGNREQSYCSLACASEAKMENGVQDIAVSNMLDTKEAQAQKKRERQLEVFTELAFELDRDPLLKEWKERCEEKGVSKRLRTKFGFDTYGDLKESAKAYNHRVESVEYVGEETVYNGTVDDTHNFYFGNWDEDGRKIFINSLNCGEVPLEIGGACRLTAMNLFSFVRNPFTQDAYFDFDKFRESVRIGQRIMDDIVQLDIEKIEEIIEKVKSDDEPESIKHHELSLWNNILDHAKESRRTGLGLTALGDMFAGLGIRYGSEESREFADKVLRTQKVEAYRESVNLAKERGAFDLYDHSRERGNPFIERLREDDEELVQEMEEHGRRNIAVLSIAPTGTVSQMAETTSGIENLFQPYYQRRRKVNPDDEEVEVDFVDEVGDAWQEFIVFHPRFEQYLDVQGYDVDTDDPDMERLEEIRKESPYDGATVSDVDWVSKVKLQGVIQKHIDHSISVTTNLPEDISVERVKDVYEESWRAGCFVKGTPVYTRDGVKSIEDIETGDRVFDHEGNLSTVDETFELQSEGRKHVTLNITGYEDLSATAEHPVLVASYDDDKEKYGWRERSKSLDWKKIDNVQPGDHIVIPKFEMETDPVSSIGLLDFIEEENVIVEEDEVYPSRPLPWKESVITKCPNSTGVKYEIEVDQDFCKFVGWFVAEGHFMERSIRMNFHLDEEEIANELAEIIEDKFGVSSKIFKMENENGSSLRLKTSSRLLRDFMKSLVGEGSHNKHLPEFFTELSARNLETLVNAHYNGDAGVSVSDRLIEELSLARHILQHRVYRKNNSDNTSRVKLNESENFSSGKPLENYTAYRVRSKESEWKRSKVYNLSVEESDSYLVRGFAVHNCKGCTIYRQGSRSGVLTDAGDSGGDGDGIVYNDAPERPEELECDIHQVRYSGEPWKILVGNLDGDPYEIFAIKTGGDTGIRIRFTDSNDNAIEEGVIVKQGSGVYDLEAPDGKTIVEDIADYAPDDQARVATRLLSLALRHGVKPKYIVNQLESANGSVVSFGRAVLKAMRRYLDVEPDDACPECGEDQLVYQENCVTCRACGYSKCS